MGNYTFIISGIEPATRTVDKGKDNWDTYTVSYQNSNLWINQQGTNISDRVEISSSITYHREVSCEMNIAAFMGSGNILINIPLTSGGNYVWGDSKGEAYDPGLSSGQINTSWTTINVPITNARLNSTGLGFDVTTSYYNNNRFDARDYYTRNDSISGNYTVPEYSIAILSNNNSYGTVSGYDPVQQNNFSDSRSIEYLITGVTLTATPKQGYKFKNWTITGTNTEVSTSASYELPGITAATNYTANFEPITYTLKYNSNGGSGEMETVELKYNDTYYLKDSTFNGPKVPVTFNGNGATQSYNQVKYYSRLFDNIWQYTDPEGNLHYYAPGDNIANTFLVADGSTVELQAIWNNNIIINDFETPFRQHHLFKGWLRNDGELYFENSQPIIVDCTKFNNFIAQWEKYQFRAFLITDDSEHYKRIPYLFLKDKKIKRLIIYTPELGYKEI